MKIHLTKNIPDGIINQISRFFFIAGFNSPSICIKHDQSNLSNILITANILNESECLFKDPISFSTSINTVTVADNILAVILKFDVKDSIDIDFIFKPDSTEIIFKDSLYWRSFYFWNKRELHDSGQIYHDISPAIISYMIHGQYVHESMEGAVEETLMELYQKGEPHFKNLLVLKDMIKI